MEASSSGPDIETASSSSKQLHLCNLPNEKVAQIFEFIPKKFLFPLLLVSRKFHAFASARIYRELTFLLTLPESSSSHKDSSYRLSEALHTFLTSDYNYAQHVKSFGVRMVENDTDHVQKRVAAKFLPQEEAGMLLNTALFCMIKRAKGLEHFLWQVPIECSSQVYEALAKAPSLQTLHLHMDVAAISKHSYATYIPPPPPPPGAAFGGQTAVWWDPMSISSMNSGTSGSAGSNKSTKSTAARTKHQNRKIGGLNHLKHLTITCIDDLSFLDEVAICVAGSSRSLRTITISLAESLVAKSQKPQPNNSHNNNVPHPDDDASTDQGSPDLNATNVGPTDQDLKKEKQAQEQTLARIFGLDKAPTSVQKEEKKFDKALKHSAKSVGPIVVSGKGSFDRITGNITDILEASRVDPTVQAKIVKLIAKFTQPDVSQNSNMKVSKQSSGKEKKKGTVIPASSSKYLLPSADYYEAAKAGLFSNPSAEFSGQSIDFDLDPLASTGPATTPGLWNHSLDSPQNPLAFGNSLNLAPANKSIGNHGSPLPFSAYPLHSIPPSHPVTMSSSVSAHFSPSPSVVTKQIWNRLVGLLRYAKLDDTALLKVFKVFEEFLELKLKEANSGFQNNQLYTIKKGKKSNLNPGPPIVEPSDSSSESSSDIGSKSEILDLQTDAKLSANKTAQTEEQDYGVDMDHPDEVEGGSTHTSDQELECEDSNMLAVDDSKNLAEETEASSTGAQAAAEDDSLAIPADDGKGKQKGDHSHPSSAPDQVSDAIITQEATQSQPKTLDESIQEYIRMIHGLGIEELALSYVPLKASILAKALDLKVLKRIVLYNTGAQGAFWAMIEKMVDLGTVFSLDTIYTDDVSPAFVSCLSKLPGLKSLHLLRRSSKEFLSTSNRPPASIHDIHKIGLVKHFETLQSLSITNLDDDSWDFDDKLVRALSTKARKLREVAFSLDANSFHTFLRCLPGLRNLVALHIINIKVAGTPSIMPHNEWKKLILDIVCYYPSLRLKYVGITLNTNGRVSQIGEKPKLSVSSWYKKQEENSIKNSKGKGKAPISKTGDVSGDIDDDSDADDERPNAVYSKTWRPSALADSYAIFSSMVLRGRL